MSRDRNGGQLFIALESKNGNLAIVLMEQSEQKCQQLFKFFSAYELHNNEHLKKMAQKIVDDYYGDFESGEIDFTGSLICDQKCCQKLGPLEQEAQKMLTDTIISLISDEELIDVYNKSENYG